MSVTDQVGKKVHVIVKVKKKIVGVFVAGLVFWIFVESVMAQVSVKDIVIVTVTNSIVLVFVVVKANMMNVMFVTVTVLLLKHVIVKVRL